MHVKEQLRNHLIFQLKLKGMRIEEGTESGADSDFLMALMEINEVLDEAQTPEEANKIGQDTKGICMHLFTSLIVRMLIN